MICNKLIIQIIAEQNVREGNWVYDSYSLPIGKALKAGMKGEYVPVETALCGQLFIKDLYLKKRGEKE